MQAVGSISQAAPAASFQPTNQQDQKRHPERKPNRAKDKTGTPPSRFSLRMSANLWRSLQSTGMCLHWLAPPMPPSADFVETIPSTLSNIPGRFQLHFYRPKDYLDSKSTLKTYPAVINFHGGGFTIGNATDDARFARFVTDICNAVFISVDYRLAPEHPFPTAVNDGADAILHIIRHAKGLRIDPLKLVVSGFSAGGNIAITAPLRLSSPSADLEIPEHKILALTALYPVVDYTLTRAERRATSVRPDQNLSTSLTDLFDASYLYPPGLDLADPLLSPAKAEDELLIQGIPPHVLIYTCEWDMLMREGKAFAERLAKEPIKKEVYHRTIPGVSHGWDKHPAVLQPPAGSEDVYRECCQRLKDIFADS